jgi:hypothetical protein
VEMVFVSGKEFPFSTTGSTFELCYEPSKKLPPQKKGQRRKSEKHNNHSKNKDDKDITFFYIYKYEELTL